jgi:hypothetical protein
LIGLNALFFLGFLLQSCRLDKLAVGFWAFLLIFFSSEEKMNRSFQGWRPGKWKREEMQYLDYCLQREIR